MGINRRDWLKTAFLGGAALAFSPLEILAKQTPNYSLLNNDEKIL
jgi:histidinol-phosphate aminotransferase